MDLLDVNATRQMMRAAAKTRREGKGGQGAGERRRGEGTSSGRMPCLQKVGGREKYGWQTHGIRAQGRMNAVERHSLNT